MLKILHLHGFKCAGTTFSWILERCLSGNVRYIESSKPGARLDWRRVHSSVDLLGVEAVSSHLIDLPPPDKLAELKIFFVRDPVARLQSEYNFLKDKQKRVDENTTFRQFVEQRGKVFGNYMTRQLSPQDHCGWDSREGWQLRPELIDFSRNDLFVGIVERFDDSIIVLEWLLSLKGIHLDMAYPSAMNAATPDKSADSSSLSIPKRPPWLYLSTELDDVLVQRANQRLDEFISSIDDFSQRQVDFQVRCQIIRDIYQSQSIKVAPSAEWIYL